MSPNIFAKKKNRIEMKYNRNKKYNLKTNLIHRQYIFFFIKKKRKENIVQKVCQIINLSLSFDCDNQHTKKKQKQQIRQHYYGLLQGIKEIS